MQRSSDRKCEGSYVESQLKFQEDQLEPTLQSYCSMISSGSLPNEGGPVVGSFVRTFLSLIGVAGLDTLPVDITTGPLV